MKMTKKIMLAAVAMAAVMVVGCKKVIGDIKWEGTLADNGNQTTTYKVNQLNDSDAIIRGAKEVGLTDRAGGTCVITLNNQTSNTKDGVVGFIAGLEQDKTTGLYSFLVIGVQNNNGTMRYYASMFYNIDGKNLSADNFGASLRKDKFYSDVTEPYEICITSYDSSKGHNWKDLGSISNWKNSDDKIKILIDVKTVKETKNINFDVYNAKELVITSGENAQGAFEVSEKTLTKVNTDVSTVTAAQNGRDESNDVKGGIWTYANIQPTKTLNAQWDVYNLTYKGTDAQNSMRAAFSDIDCGDIDWE